MMRLIRSYRVRKGTNFAGIILAGAAVVLAIIPLAAMLAYVLGQGGSSLDLSFFTNTPKATGESGGGVLNSIVGTLLLVVLASLFGMPVGILGGIYLARGRTGFFVEAVRFFTDVIAGTPSIVAGIVAYALVVIPMHTFSAFSGGIALALLMFPTVTRATEEAIKLVPASVREAGLAIGLPEWKTMFRITLPAAGAGIVTALLLGVARVAGETAPLLFTAFGNPDVQLSPLQPVEGLPVQIWNYATGPYADWHRQAWAGAFVLFAIVFILNVGARILTRRVAARTGAA